jgi:hypothetical protein
MCDDYDDGYADQCLKEANKRVEQLEDALLVSSRALSSLWNAYGSSVHQQSGAWTMAAMLKAGVRLLC